MYKDLQCSIIYRKKLEIKGIVITQYCFLIPQLPHCKMETILSTTINNAIIKQEAKDYLPANQAD